MVRTAFFVLLSCVLFPTSGSDVYIGMYGTDRPVRDTIILSAPDDRLKVTFCNFDVQNWDMQYFDGAVSITGNLSINTQASSFFEVDTRSVINSQEGFVIVKPVSDTIKLDKDRFYLIIRAGQNSSRRIPAARAVGTYPKQEMFLCDLQGRRSKVLAQRANGVSSLTSPYPPHWFNPVLLVKFNRSKP